MKEKYVKPLISMIKMETEQTVMTLSSYNTTGDKNQPGFDINEGNPGEDGTDLTKNTGAKGFSVWD